MMNKKVKFQTPTGMHDILPEDQPFYQKVYGVFGVNYFLSSNGIGN